MGKPLVQIITPAYNEAAVLERLATELKAVFETLSERYAFEHILVVDRSTDATFEVARKLAETDSRIKVVHLSRRFGHQLALKAGLDHADADVVIMMDSDLQHPPSLIPTLLEEYEKGSSVVYTRRVGSQQSLLKDICSAAFYRVINSVSRIQLIPASSDFRLVNRKVLQVLQDINEFDPFWRGICRWVGFSSAVVDYQLQPRAAGRSKYRLRDSARLAVSGITSFSALPLQVGIYAGIASLLVALLLFCLFAILVTRRGAMHWELLQVLLITFFGGMQIFLVGVIGEYVGRTFLAQKQRPLYLVDDCIGFSGGDNL